jgi:hypothetical protein
MRSLGLAFLALLLTSITMARPAAAIEGWCADDPLVAVNGSLLDIQVQMPVGQLLTMRSTTLTVIIPSNATGMVVLDNVSAFPMKTTVSATGPEWNSTGSIPITIVADVKADQDYPIRVVATPVLPITLLGGQSIAQGTANVPLSMPMMLAR